MARTKTLSPSGHVAGASHHRARLSTETINTMRATYWRLVAEGRAGPGGLGYGWFAQRFGCSASTARDILQFRTRVAS
jgi:hypothetical protein